MFFWFYNGYPRVSFGSRLVFQWFGLGCTAPGYSVSSLWPTQERVAGAAQKCSRRSGAPKSFKMVVFFKLFVRVSGYEALGCSRALTSVLSSYARTEEDIIKGFPGGGGERREERMHLGSRPLCRGWLEQLRHAPDAPTFIWVWRGGARLEH